MGSPKTSLVKCQSVTVIVNMMLRSWAAKVTAAQGSKQLARDVLEGAVSTYTAERWQGEIPTWQGSDDQKEQVGRESLFAGVMTMEQAYACVDDASVDCVARYKAQRALQVRKVKRWRWWVSEKISTSVMARERLMARIALEAVALKKGRRIGRQKISTTSRNKVPDAGQFVFGGRSAWRQPVGRPALPEADWWARYMNRKSRRQQRNATSIKRNRGTVTVPTTKFPRPSTVEVLGK